MSQEHIAKIQDQLKSGLRKQANRSDEKAGLISMINMVPAEFGCDASNVSLFRNPFNLAVLGSTAFPYVWVTSGASLPKLVVTSNEIYSFNSLFELTKLTTYNTVNRSTPITVTADRWHYVDLVGSGFAIGEFGTMFFSSLWTVNPTTWPNRIYYKADPGFTTGCTCMGRLVLGGLNSSKAYKLWGIGLGQNYVMWSAIANNVAFWDLFTDVYDADIAQDLMTSNTVGYMKMEWPGPVRNLQSLGQAVVVFGDDGVSLMMHTLDPYPTFGCKTLTSAGVRGRNAAGSNDKAVIWIDAYGNLWSMSSDYQPNRLGYSEFFLPMTPSTINIISDPTSDDMYITGSVSGVVKGYVLSNLGLSEIGYCPTSLYSYGGYLNGFFSGTSDDAVIQSGIIDFGFPGLKTIISINAVYHGLSNVCVRLYVRYSATGEFYPGPSIPVNDEGNVLYSVTGQEFIVELTGEHVTTGVSSIESISVRWTPEDFRAVRGRYQ